MNKLKKNKTDDVGDQTLVVAKENLEEDSDGSMSSDCPIRAISGSLDVAVGSGTISTVRPGYGTKAKKQRGGKRALSELDSDSEDVPLAQRKISKVIRGRGGGKLLGSESQNDMARAIDDLEKPSAETYRLNKSTTELSKTKAKPAKKTYTQIDGEAFNANELTDRAFEELNAIQEASRKSKNLKGTIQSAINQSVVTLRGVLDDLKQRTLDDETRRLRADNERLSRELSNMRTELTALRRDYEEGKTRPVEGASAASFSSSHSGVDIEDVVRRVTIAVGEMVNARLAGIEDRLLPAKTIRPPLAADKKKATDKVTTTPVPPAREASRSAGPANPGSSYANTQTTTSQARAATADDAEEGWSTFTKKGRKKKPTAPTVSQQPEQQKPAAGTPKVAKPKRKKNLTLPRSSAVVITLHAEALDRGVTYTDVLTRAKEAIDLTELGIEGVRSRQAATGARILELPGASSGSKADLLAKKLQSTLADVARVVRPVKSVDLRISGLDDSISAEAVVTAITSKEECSSEHIKVGMIRMGPGGTRVVNVQCPIAVGRALLSKGRLLVGWSSAQVLALDSRPLRCFRCMGIGHTRLLCTSEVDRGELCFRCGKEGHKAATCTVDPRCAVCAHAHCPYGHVMGGRNCNPPASKGRLVPGNQNTPPTTRSNVTETAVMSD